MYMRFKLKEGQTIIWPEACHNIAGVQRKFGKTML